MNANLLLDYMHKSFHVIISKNYLVITGTIVQIYQYYRLTFYFYRLNTSQNLAKL